MKTKITQKKYSILEIDEEGLIPKEAISAIVIYKKDEPKRIYFIPDLKKYKKEFKKRDNDTIAEIYWKRKQIRKRYTEEVEKINGLRTKEEMTQITSRLEQSLK